MKKYDLLILGFGKGGKTLAKTASAQGKQVAVVEQSKKCRVVHVSHWLCSIKNTS